MHFIRNYNKKVGDKQMMFLQIADCIFSIIEKNRIFAF